MKDEEKAKKKCFIFLCPNFLTRYKHSKKAEEQAKAVAELLEQGNFDRVWYRAAWHGIMAPSVKDFEEFESRSLVLDGIMEALKDDSVSVIGVHGMGGVGKTTLVKEVARQVMDSKLFDPVVIANVTQTLDVKEIQNQIAELVGLTFGKQSMVGRALRLHDRLKEEKKILVVLDDIWAKLDLEEVGIPFGDEHKGCKILLTSRDLNVLSNGMDTQKDFAVGLLNEKEAWALFKKMAGDCVENCDLQPTAMEVAKKCAGLPIAIVTVARALRNKVLFEWENALRELKRPSPSNFTGITAVVYSAIELSFNYLESEEVKLTFLLCSLIGHNGFIEDLVRYTLGLGFFDGVYTMKECRDKVSTVVKNLKASCLLLDSYKDELFDIHDIVWDVALSIASRDRHMLVLRDGNVPKEWRDKKKMKNCSAISLRSPCIMGELPEEMECSDLSFFHMAHDGSVKIPSDFFRRTESLKVLDLFGMRFPSLPQSINHLTELRMLGLKQCALEDITVIGKLKMLEILSLARSDIKALPQEIAQLTRLKSLDLSCCNKLKSIPPNVLSSLSKLEELFMDNSFAQWEDELLGNQRRNASLAELNHLPQLTTLYAHIPNAQMIPKYLVIEKLDRYRIFIGDDYEWDWYEEYEYSRTLKFRLNTNICLDHGVKMLLNKTEDLYLEGLQGIKNVLAELNNGEDFPHLQKLHVQNCMEVQYITMKKIELSQLRSMTLTGLPQLISFCYEDKRCSTSQQQEADTSSEPSPLFNKQFVFPHLESLQLSSINAKRIWHNQLSETYYGIRKLTSLIIQGCGNLEHLLSPSVARSLEQLQHFEIVECKCLREIVFSEEIEEEERRDAICFPRLNSLYVKDLQNLIKFCSGNYNIEFPLLKVLKIERCPKLEELIHQTKMEGSNQSGIQALFNEKFVFPHLESLQLSSINAKRIWHNQLSETNYGIRNLTSLIIQGCGNLEHLLSPSIARSLEQLQHFKIAECKCLREIIFSEEIEEGRRDAICFPRLNSLYVKHLQNLIKFCSGNYNIEFPLLQVLKIKRCPKLKEFIHQTRMEGSNQSAIQALFNEKAAIPNLERMTISHLTVKMIFDNELLAGSFRNLKEMTVKYCDELSTIFSSTLVGVFNCLETLTVGSCDSLEQISELGGLNIKETQSVDSPLRELQIFCLPKLKHVWNKDPKGILNFQNLRIVYVWECPSVKNLFPASIAKDLPLLEDLTISSCGVEEMVSVGEGLEQPIRFKFPQVSSLQLWNLNELKCFYPGQHTIVWSKLKTLSTNCSTLLKIVASEHLSIQEMNGNGQRESTIGQPLFLLEEVFPKLEELRLDNIDDIAVICNGQFPADFFHQIKVLKLNGFHGGYSIFPSLRRFYNLESLVFSSFDFKDVVRCKGDVAETRDAGTGTLTRIKKLMLQSCKNLKHIWKKDSELGQILPNLETLEVGRCDDLINIGPSSLSFQNLTTLEVSSCKMMTNLVTPSLVQNLVQLTTMRLSDCITMTEIVAIEGDGATYDQIIVFSKLKCLELSRLQSLASFCPGTYTFEFPCLEELIVNWCPSLKIFSQGVLSTPRLQRVKEWPSDNKRRWSGDLNTTIQQLYTEKGDLKFSDKFPELMEIWNKNPQENLDFKSLTRLEFCNCSSLKYIFTPSMLLSLKRLRSLKVEECSPMEEVIREQGIEQEATIDKFTFPELYYIEIVSCSNLTTFYLGSRAFEFPTLKTIRIADCPKMTAFASSFSRDNEKGTTGDASENWLDQGDLDITAAFFNNKVAVPSLERMTVSRLRNVKMIFGNELLAGSFCKLKEMTVEYCDELSTIFSSTIIGVFNCLEKLRVNNCVSLEQIFELGGLNIKETRSVDSPLRELGIFSLPKLKHVWNKDPKGILNFQNLQKVDVQGCPSLKNLFPASIAKDLPQLEDLTISSCGVEEIVSVGEGLEQPVRFKFPQVSSLELTHLNELKCFYPGQHTIVWSELKKLGTDCSTLLKIVASERLSIQEMNGNGQRESTIGQPLFLLVEVFPKLEELRLDNIDDIVLICTDQFPANFFHQIKVFEVNGLHRGSGKCIFPSLRRFYNLESLQFSDFDFKDVVLRKGDVAEMRDAGTGTLARIRKLKLESSKNLMHIWKKDSELAQILPNVETLEVSCCHDLINIGPSSLSFQNLTTLKVFGCGMMTNLVTPSLVQNLVQLTTMRVEDCITMTEIVATEGDGATSDQIIVFSKLKCLELSSLQSLASFCPGNYTFEFPCLEELIVNRCPSLKIFSQGVLSTPRLRRVKRWRFGDKGRWSGDLNSTIQQLFTEKVGFHDLELLKLSDTFPVFMEIWNTNPQEILDFESLESLEFCNCSNLKYIFTPSMLLSLKRLRRLKVEECSTMEEVIREQGVEEEAKTDKFTFPKLSSIEIVSCFNLTTFCLGSRAFEFPSLQRIKIADCPKMSAFASSVTREKEKETSGDASDKVVGQGDLDTTATFFNDKVVFPSLEQLTISGMRDCRKIWQDPLSANSFCKLNEIRVEGCETLLNIFPFSMMERLEELEKLDIQNCESLEEIIEPQGLIANESHAVADTVTKFVFPKVTYLRFGKLPRLKSFYSRMHTTEWPSLKQMEVIECHQVEIFSSKSPCFGETQSESQVEISNQQPLFWVNEDTFPILEELTVKQKDLMEGICHGQLSMECFRKLKVLNLECFPETSTSLPYCFIQSLPNLEKFFIKDASFCQIVQFEGLGDEERHSSALTQIKELRLSKRPELTHLWKKEFQPGAALCNLRILEVLECGKLRTLEPSLLSFKNLTTLEVSRCHGFINLIACSTAKSLMLLERMSITDCELIEEIIACEFEGIQGGIVFAQLKYLQLSCLPSLASFSLGDHMFEFPVLQTVIVRECPKMMNFCQGDLSTPKLQQVQLIGDEDEVKLRWEGDLNTTLKHLFNEMNVLNPEVTEVTHQLPKPE